MTRSLISGMLVVASAAVVAAQSPGRYDRAAERAITGTIQTVVSFPDTSGAVGVHFDLQTAEGLVSVHVGPALYIGQQNFWFYAGETIDIVGTRQQVDGNVAVWAKAIQKGGDMLVLRNADGTPKWAPAIDATDGCGVNHPALQRGTER
jgi:hypothetical protein